MKIEGLGYYPRVDISISDAAPVRRISMKTTIRKKGPDGLYYGWNVTLQRTADRFEDAVRAIGEFHEECYKVIIAGEIDPSLKTSTHGAAVFERCSSQVDEAERITGHKPLGDPTTTSARRGMTKDEQAELNAITDQMIRLYARLQGMILSGRDKPIGNGLMDQIPKEPNYRTPTKGDIENLEVTE